MRVRRTSDGQQQCGNIFIRYTHITKTTIKRRKTVVSVKTFRSSDTMWLSSGAARKTQMRHTKWGNLNSIQMI